MKRLCVFCGSSAGETSVYLNAATAMGEALVRNDLGLVYGGSRVGLMGRIAATVLEAGGEVTGVIPEALVNREVPHSDLTELRVVDSMHERKAVMAELSDGFVALPGGVGTLEGFSEVLTWAQLGLHRKPCGILDVNRYYRSLIEFLDHALQQGFLARSHRRIILVERDPDALIQEFRDYDPPALPRWIRSEET